jgi:protease-4
MAAASNEPNPEGNDTGRPPVNPNNPSAPPPPPPGGAYQPAPAKRGGGLARTLAGIMGLLLISSLAVNVWLSQIVNTFFAGPHEVTYAEGTSDQRIVILPVEGMIDGRTAEFLRESLDQLRGANAPAGIVLRVDSGGGGVGPSDRIWHHLRRFREQTDVPIVASFGSVAASGGYYIAADSDHIIAERSCTTGSIGVMGMAFTVEELMDKIGITPEILEAPGSPEKGVANNIFRPWNEEDRQVVRQRLSDAHQQFVQVVRDGRIPRSEELTEQRVSELASGQTFSAEEALKAHLVDEVGYLRQAIEKAAELGGIPSEDEPRVMEMEPQRQLGIGSMFAGLIGTGASDGEPWDAQRVRSFLMEVNQRELLYRAPIGR